MYILTSAKRAVASMPRSIDLASFIVDTIFIYPRPGGPGDRCFTAPIVSRTRLSGYAHKSGADLEISDVAECPGVVPEGMFPSKMRWPGGESLFFVPMEIQYNSVEIGLCPAQGRGRASREPSTWDVLGDGADGDSSRRPNSASVCHSCAGL